MPMNYKTLQIIAFFLLITVSCKKHVCLQQSTSSYYSLKSIEAKGNTDSLILLYKSTLEYQMNKPLVVCKETLTKDGDETTLGNFVCDALRWISDSIYGKLLDGVVLVNRGGLRTNLNTGTVTVNAIFELMPFDNELEIVEINGAELMNVFDEVIHKRHPFLGAKIKQVGSSAPEIRINDEYIKTIKTYFLITSDYLVNGGDSFTFGNKAITSRKPGIKIREAIIYYCKYLQRMGKSIFPYTDGRLEITK